MEIPWILIAILVFLIILGILAIFAVKARKGKQRPIDYQNWFAIGIVWMGIGLVWIKENMFFFIMGLVFMAMGLAHHKEWKKGREANKWKNLNKAEKKIRIWLLIILGVLVLAGLIVFLWQLV